MANTFFSQAFPDIATSLIKQIIRNGYECKRMYLLVLPNLLEKARMELDKIIKEFELSEELFMLISGDITKKDLGILSEVNEQLQSHVTHIFHLAAIYDLAVPKDLAYQANVIGTLNMNNWILSLHTVQRYIYFSTSYVAGDREGRILETELVKGQGFKNYYEQTKYEAELAVRDLMKTVPTTVIRPGIVVGNTATGETIKFDGPYFILNFFDKLTFLPFLPYLGKGKAEGNFVPVDYIFNAAIYLGHAEIGIGKTYQLTDPKPYRIKEVYRMLMVEFLGREPVGMIPLSLSKWLLSIPAFRKWTRVEKEALDYFTCMAEYDCSQTQQDLRGSGILCPDFKDVILAMVAYYKKHKNDSEKQLEIH